MTIKHIKPGDPEFNAISETITPIHRVHSISYKSTYIDEERGRQTIRRRESVDVIR